MASPVNQYEFIAAPSGVIQTTLAQKTAQGWRPILMSTSADTTSQIQVCIILEKPTGA
jgi:hypothetical protein